MCPQGIVDFTPKRVNVWSGTYQSCCQERFKMASQQEIERLAYELWEQHGRPEGDDQAHYYQAKQALNSDGTAAPKRTARKPAAGASGKPRTARKPA